MANSIQNILEDLSEDSNRKGLFNTSKQHARAILFLTKRYNKDIFDIVKSIIFEIDYNSIILIWDINLFSICEHYLLPF